MRTAGRPNTFSELSDDDLSYGIQIIKLLRYVFPFFVVLCYDTVVPGERDEIKKRKKETIMKKVSVLLEELYVTFIHGRG